MSNKISLIAGTANLELAKEISSYLKEPLNPIEVKNFNDGEIYIHIEKSVRGSVVFIIQPTSTPVNENLMQLLLIIDACKRASAKEINAVIPYYGYSRQDRKALPREPISAKLVANLIEAAGVSRVVTFDLHVDQIQGFFDIPVDNLTAMPILAKSLMQKKLKDIVVVAPDIGSAIRARRLAKSFNCEMAIIDKRRGAQGESEVLHLIGNVKGKSAVLIDDIIDTGGTISNAASEVMKHGAKEVYIFATHGIFSKDAMQKLSNKDIKEVVITDSIPCAKKIPKIRVVSLASYIAELISSIYHGEPMGIIVKGKEDQIHG